jgi:hypothetical protein
MSTDYRLEKSIRAADVLDGRLMAFGVQEQLCEYTTEASKCLTDGGNYIWLYIDDGGFVVDSLSSFGENDPSAILEAIATTFDTEIFSEHEPQFWGCASQEELDAWMEQMSKEAEDRFYAELIKYLRGEPSDINPHTVQYDKALIAKTLADADPELLVPEMREKLIGAVEEIYKSDPVQEKLMKEDPVYALIAATHKDGWSSLKGKPRETN